MTDNDEKELKTIKFQMMLSPTEADDIDTWSFDNRIRSRAEAIRRLCRIGTLWDGVSADLFSELDAAVDALRKHQEAALEALGSPSPELPRWVVKYVIASLKTNLATMDHLSKIADISRRAASPADIMKFKGRFSEVHAASLAIEHGILQEALDKFQGKTEEKNED